MTYTFPKGSINCIREDYIVRREPGGKWGVYLVEDLVLLSRLVPLKFPRGVELLEEKDATDSAKPAYFGEIHLLLTHFGAEFEGRDAAVQAIDGGSLGGNTPHLCLPIAEFTNETSSVYRRPR